MCPQPAENFLSCQRDGQSVSVGAQRHRKRRPRALFLSIPLYGHIRPLLLQARALARRGWDVFLASMDEARAFVEPMVPFEGLGGDPPGAPSTAEVFALATTEPNFRKGSCEILAWIHARWGSLYDGALALGHRWAPDLIVSDIVTTSGIDVADLLGVPIVLNNAH